MKYLFNPIYRQEYLKGYSVGLEQPYHEALGNQTEAYYTGFKQGRLDYESMNGKIMKGIPDRIVTNKVLEDFLLAGMLGMSIDMEGYTDFQIRVIEKWYQSGVEIYDPQQGEYLLSILEMNEIDIYQY
ncbi:MAG: hypothetical protein ACI7YS_14595 [Flavobacterium sp.]